MPIGLRSLRGVRNWRQQDLADRAGLSRDVVSRAECGEMAGATVGSLDRLAEALSALLVVELRWEGAALDRLVDRDHALLQEAVDARARGGGWITHIEVSFNHYGDRGRCDVVAWHPSAQLLLVVEVKSRIGNVQETLGSLDTKRRLGGVLCEQLGYPPPRGVAAVLVIAEHRTARRVIAQHPGVFDAFSLRGRAATQWLAAPHGAPTGLLWFELLPDSGGSRITQRQRIRLRANAS